MNKAQTIQALKEGKKVRHRFFYEGEHVSLDLNTINQNPVIFVFEDGYTQTEKEFWDLRNAPEYNDHWEIVN